MAAKERAIAEASGLPLPVGVVLAGGLARRMGGGDKGLLPLAGRPLLSHVTERLGGQVAGLVLNANGDPSRFDALGVPVIADPVGDYPGPLAGVLAGLYHAREVGAEAIVTVAADTPFFPLDLVARLRAASEAEKAPIALAATREGDGRIARHPTFGLWRVELADALNEAIVGGTRKIVAFTDAHGAATALFEADGDPFFNVNTPDDLSKAETLAAARAPASAS